MNIKKGTYFVIILILISSFLITCNHKDDGAKIERIYLIIIDTLRADHLSCYGYPWETSPFIDSLAEKGILFERAYSQSASTCPSIASIFTGLYPFQHRVLANGYVLENSYTTLAEILNENGFRTAGFASIARALRGAKISQGFDFYEDGVGTIKLIQGNYRSARLTKNSAVTWLDNFDKDQKLFMWLHFYDTHLPYFPPERHVREIKQCINRDDYMNYFESIPIDMEVYNYSQERLYGSMLSYDSEIRYVDAEISHFYRYIQNRGLNENALWIITADHGEGLGQHQWYRHGKLLYQEAVHVPLIFYFSNETIKPKRISDVVENIDIFSTLLKGLGMDLNKSLKKEVQSISLWERIHGDSPLKKKFSFSERRKYETNQKNKFPNRPEWELNWEKGEAYCIQNNKFKYIYKTHLQDEFYNLGKDPFELKNLIDNQEYKKPRILLKEELFKILKEKEFYKKRALKKVNREELNMLRSLGYIL